MSENRCSGGGVNPGNPMKFTVNLTDPPKNSNLEYFWTVSQGKIVEGQGTTAIKIDTTGLDTNITATIEIKGLSEGCQNTASETGSVINEARSWVIAEFGKLRDDEVKEKIDAMYREMKFPLARGYIISYGTDREVAAREKQIWKSLPKRSEASTWITNVRGGSNPNGKGVWTKIWIVPLEADNPQP